MINDKIVKSLEAVYIYIYIYIVNTFIRDEIYLAWNLSENINKIVNIRTDMTYMHLSNGDIPCGARVSPLTKCI